MTFWIIQDGEPLPGIDEGARSWRCGALAGALAARGHQVLWWASTFNHARKKHRCKESCTVDMNPAVKVRLLHGPGYKTNRSLKRFVHQRAIARALARETEASAPPDIIICSLPLPELAQQAIVYGQKHHVPVVIDVRDPWPDIYLTAFPSSLRSFARLALSTEFRRIKLVFRSASAILSVSDTYLKWALNYAGRPRRRTDGVFPLGYHETNCVVDEADRAEFRARYGIRAESMLVAFVGIFGSSYDLETVVRAARTLSRQGVRQVQIVLAGDGDAGARIREMARCMPDLVCTGWLDMKAVKTLLGISSVGLAAYRREAMQTLPNKPFEYMAAGLPLLSSLTGELEDLIRKEQIGVQYLAGSADLLAERIGWLAANPDVRRSMGQRARKLYDRLFSSDVIYPEMVRHLEDIVSRVEQ